MKYEKKSKSKLVDAVQIVSIADAGRAYADCPYVIKAIISVEEGDTINDSVIFETEKEDVINLVFGEYLVWNDTDVWVMSEEKFEKKYARYDDYKINTGIIWPNTLASTATSNGFVKGA